VGSADAINGLVISGHVHFSEQMLVPPTSRMGLPQLPTCDLTM
jgi:hypothetical protein